MHLHKAPVNDAVSRRTFLAGAGCVAAVTLLDGCGDLGTVAPSLGARPVHAYALNHFIVTGQSLSQGASGTPALSKTQPFNNKMFTFPDIPGAASRAANYNALTKGYSNLSLRPLINGPAPNGTGTPLETLSNGFADSISARLQGEHAPSGAFEQLMSCSGVGGARYIQIAGPTDVPPGGSPSFQEMMSQVSLGRSLAAAAGLGYNVPAMLVVHGEADSVNDEYATNLKTWQADMQAGVNAITGRDEIIPMIASQTQSLPASVHRNGKMPFESGAGSLGTLAAAITNPGLICLACPEYMMAHSSIHMTSDGYRHLGMMMAKAAFQIVLEGKWWWPLMPETTRQIGDVIKIGYRVPYGPIVIDTSWVSDPGNYGFSYADSAGTTITGVEVTGPAEISVRLSSAMTGGMISYALPPAPAVPDVPGYGTQSGPRGCVRDSDPMVSYYNDSKTGKPYPLQNYSIGWQTAL